MQGFFQHNTHYSSSATITYIPGYGDLDEDVETIRRVGAERIVIASDSGQPRALPPPETLRVYAQLLFEKGITEDQLDLMLRRNPRWLLDYQAAEKGF